MLTYHLNGKGRERLLYEQFAAGFSALKYALDFFVTTRELDRYLWLAGQLRTCKRQENAGARPKFDRYRNNFSLLEWHIKNFGYHLPVLKGQKRKNKTDFRNYFLWDPLKQPGLLQKPAVKFLRHWCSCDKTDMMKKSLNTGIHLRVLFFQLAGFSCFSDEWVFMSSFPNFLAGGFLGRKRRFLHPKMGRKVNDVAKRNTDCP